MFLSFVILFSGVVSAGDSYTSILKSFKNSVGFSARDLDGKVIAEVNSNLALAPASVAKTVSSACSLSTLGASHQFETQFGYRGNIKAGVLNGDLVIKGEGDPSYVIEDLKENLERLFVVYGLKEIKGSLVFDTTYFEKPSLDISDDFEGDEGRSFRAPLTSTALDFNSFAVWAVPGFDGPRVETLPKAAVGLKIESAVKSQSGTENSIAVDYRTRENKIVVSGQVGRSGEGKAIYRALEDPYASMAGVVARVWHDLGGVGLVKSYQISSKPVASEKIFAHRSKPLSRIIMDINKLSTNFGAEMILLGAGAEKFGAPATVEKSKAVLAECLKKYSISSTRITLENASGLSRKSTIEPGALTEFLAKISAEEFAPEYLSSLSVLGRDGTTKSRLKQFAGRARLKTGTIKNVRTIAGFVYPLKGSPKVFALFFNCSSCSDSAMLRAEDEVISNLIESK